MLRDSFIDWGTFLDIYHDNLEYTQLFNQTVKLLNIEENENIRSHLIPLVKKIYHLPASAHIACMMKQFMIYEPVSIAIHSLFTTIKSHYESVAEQYIKVRNEYIERKGTKDQLNNFEALKKQWEEIDQQYSLDSSSLTLLFLNPPNEFKTSLNITIKDVPSTVTLKQAIKKFHYLGYCPKVPRERLKALLDFPINEFVHATKALNPEVNFPDYAALEKYTAHELKKMPTAPVVVDKIPREAPPNNLDTIELAKWYVNAILDIRKSLIDYGNKYEEFYLEQAKIFVSINERFKKEFLN
jgi:hypothetical protein